MTVYANPQLADHPVASPVAATIWRLALKRAKPIVKLNNGSRGPRVYCIHPVTGDVVGLQVLADHFGMQQLHGIQVPKQDMNAAYAGSIEAMATRYVTMIAALQPEGPINLMGWSAGAIIALEMAQQFVKLGREVPLLVALDGAPCNTGAGLRIWHPLYIVKLALNLPRWIRDDRSQDWSWRGILRRLESKLVYRFGVGVTKLPSQQTLDGETIQTLLETKGWLGEQKAFIHAMYKAMVDYVPAPYAGRVLVFETKTQPLIHLRQIGATWKKIAARTQIVLLEGNHSSIIADPTSGIIARHLLDCLAEHDRG